MKETNLTKRPEAIRSRADAVELWKHLLGRGISFHWEDDPGDWVDREGRKTLSAGEVKGIRKLFTQVARLKDPRCYDDALSLFKLAVLTGIENVSRVTVRHAGAFQTCGSPEEAMSILERIESRSGAIRTRGARS